MNHFIYCVLCGVPVQCVLLTISASGRGWGAVEITFKTRNILWIVLLQPLVISFNEGRQGLLERHVPLGWDELGKMGEGGMGYLQESESSLRRKNNVWGGSPKPIEIFFNGVWRVVMKKKCRDNRFCRFCKMLCVASAKSRNARGASHQPAFMGSCLTIGHMCSSCLSSGRWVNPRVLHGPLCLC